jgi:heme-degrading monooxygenase HmoA
MTTIGMHYDVIAGKEQEFEAGFLSVLEHLKSVPGHVESHLFQVGNFPGRSGMLFPHARSHTTSQSNRTG